ncbi:PREDICTED: UDP-glucuronosyltransferase 2B31-like, partial [Propithecus coquereli]|uniref:UDP-glucuronosyltransferase 2B31-like n=1 Tax=Propithecus coquereli TaxID=379532 RepID=UPI00063F88D2
ANVIASALAQIPQKVLWRFDGKKPDTLGPNTRLYKWLPQNDLLAKGILPEEKLSYDYSGEFLNLMDNEDIERLDDGKLRKPCYCDAALCTVFLPCDSLLYKENAMKLSRIHHDQPTKPLDRAVFWIEYVMRHKGAKHLRVAAHDLTWFQYHSLDVIGFLLACVATAIFIITKCCLFFCQMFATAGKKEKRE